MAERRARRPGAGIRRSLQAVLAAEILLAALLLMTDMQGRGLPRIGPAPDLPAGPVAPGDQVRRYEPRRLAPGVPGGGEMPPRLDFALAGDGATLLLRGPIEPGDAERFAAFLADLDPAPATVRLESPGGVVSEALAIGRRLRESGAATEMAPGAACHSACPYILAAGTERRVSARAAVGLHQHYYETPGYLPAFLAVEDIQHAQGEAMAYLIEMGIDPGVMVHALTTPPDRIYVLLPEELTESRLATSVLP